MAEFHDTRSRFETDGVFWDAQEPERTFSAHLSSGAHIELCVSAEVAGPERMFPNQALDPPAPRHVLGLTTAMGACTLIGLHELPTARSFWGSTCQVVLSRRYRVDACIVGSHLESDTSPLLSSAWFTYSGIDLWFPGAGKAEMQEKAISISYPTEFPALVDLCIPFIGSRIKVAVAPNVRWSPDGKRVTARSQPRIIVEPREPRSLTWFVNLACRFENFFSLFLGTSVRLRAVSLENGTMNDGWLVVPRRRRRGEKPDIQAWVRCDYSRLAGAIAAWFAIPEVFRPLENIVYGAIRGSSVVTETEFLALAQAIESFHRLTESTTIIPPDSFAAITKSMARTIAERYQPHGSGIVKRLLEAIRYCNEPSFHDRVGSLVSRISPAVALRLLGDTVVFEQTLRQTRNFFTHPGIKKQSRVLTEATDLFLFNQKLHAFLRLLVLLRIGFEEGEVREPVQYQSGRWGIL
jgi:hypothetical protein